MSNPSLSDIRGKRLFLGYPSGHRAQQEVRTLSIVAPSIRRRWLPITAGAAALALVAVLLIVALGDDAAAPITRPAPPAEDAAVPELPQADWVVRSYPAGMKRKPNRAIRRRVNNAAASVASTLDELYSAAFLEPETLPEATRSHMAPPAARRFRNSDITIAGAQDVQFKRRGTWIGVEGRNARRAAARTLLVVAGRLEEERFRLRHESILWLERSQGSWKVIGFEITQEPRR